MLHCLSQTKTLLTKGPAGKWKRRKNVQISDTEVCPFVYKSIYHKRARERETEKYDVMFVYLKIDLFASISQGVITVCLLTFVI